MLLICRPVKNKWKLINMKRVHINCIITYHVVKIGISCQITTHQTFKQVDIFFFNVIKRASVAYQLTSVTNAGCDIIIC